MICELKISWWNICFITAIKIIIPLEAIFSVKLPNRFQDPEAHLFISLPSPFKDCLSEISSAPAGSGVGDSQDTNHLYPVSQGLGLHPYTILGTARVGEVECHYLNGGSTKCCGPWSIKKCLPNSRRNAKCQTCLITSGFFWPCSFCLHWGAHLEEGRDLVTSLPSQVSKINCSSGNKLVSLFSPFEKKSSI